VNPEPFIAADNFRGAAQRALMNILKHRFLPDSPLHRLRFARRAVNAK
jgi:hypothetical protein